MSDVDPFERYRALRAFVGWTEESSWRVARVGGLLEPELPALIEDFYATIEAHEPTRAIITGGSSQIERLKVSLLTWLRELLAGVYDRDYVERRWRVGRRHVEIGLDQVFTNMALSRIRQGLSTALERRWTGTREELQATSSALDTLLDLDLAIIEDAYSAEHTARMQRIERLATIGQVAGGVAHELRNPLNVVKTSVYYLLHARSVTPEKRAEHLRRIERHVELADGVITTLSNFARLPVPQSASIDVAACVRRALENDPLPALVETRLDVQEGLPRVSADADQLQIVFSNLIRNARDAMRGGGSMTIEARAVAEWVEVSVADSGVGISRDDMTRIMEPLYTTKARGLGLGLAITRAILEKNRGELRVESELGRGSVFTVRLEAARHESHRSGAEGQTP